MTDDEKAALADVYERAAEYLEKCGWLQGNLGRHGRPRCFIGALSSVTQDFVVTDRAGRFAEQALALPDRDWEEGSEHPIAIWNDDPDRSADEVINLLHGLANKLR